MQISKADARSIGVQTGHDGRFSFKNVELGDYEAVVTAFGFNTERQEIEVTTKSKKCEQLLRIRLAVATPHDIHDVEPIAELLTRVTPA